jgi:pimeloyl-ACP methyl ester carboxylesterase
LTGESQSNFLFFNIFVKQIGISKPIIMGKSWGGGIALTYAVSFPNDTKTLILVNSGTNEDAHRFFVKTGIAITKFFIKIIR